MLAANRGWKNRRCRSLWINCIWPVIILTGGLAERFNRAVKAWAAGDTKQTVRDFTRQIVWVSRTMGTGLIPGDEINRVARGGGSVADSVETIYVKPQNRRHFCASSKVIRSTQRIVSRHRARDIILLDEEPPRHLYWVPASDNDQQRYANVNVSLRGMSSGFGVFPGGGS